VVSSTFFVSWFSNRSADQLDALLPGVGQQVLGKLPMIQFNRHGIECF
jgi:hypothetical protein